MFLILIKYNDMWHYRCNDGKFRLDPWYGTYGECMKTYSSVGSAKRAWSRIKNNSIFHNATPVWITRVDNEPCADLWRRIRKGKTA